MDSGGLVKVGLVGVGAYLVYRWYQGYQAAQAAPVSEAAAAPAAVTPPTPPVPVLGIRERVMAAVNADIAARAFVLDSEGRADVYHWNHYYQSATGQAAPDLTAFNLPGANFVSLDQFLAGVTAARAAQGLSGYRRNAFRVANAVAPMGSLLVGRG